MDYWLPVMLQRLESQMAAIRLAIAETHYLLQRLAILAALWAAVATLGINSPAAQEIIAAMIQALLHK